MELTAAGDATTCEPAVRLFAVAVELVAPAVPTLTNSLNVGRSLSSRMPVLAILTFDSGVLASSGLLGIPVHTAPGDVPADGMRCCVGTGWLEAKAANEGLPPDGLLPFSMAFPDRDTCGPRSPPSGLSLDCGAAFALDSAGAVADVATILLFSTCVTGARPPEKSRATLEPPANSGRLLKL